MANLEGEGNELPSFTLEEAAFLTENLWRYGFSPSETTLTQIVTARPQSNQDATVLSYPGNWGFNHQQLLSKVENLGLEARDSLVVRLHRLDELPTDERTRILSILENWIIARDNENDRAFLAHKLSQSGIKLEQFE